MAGGTNPPVGPLKNMGGGRTYAQETHGKLCHHTHKLVLRTLKLAGTNKYKDNSVEQRAGMRQKIWVVTTPSSLRHPIKKTKGRLE